ncbi:MAG: glycosyltransferase [Caulobacteraceae bacterium]
MISVIIATKNDEARLARALASFVTAAVDALVTEVIVADAGSDDATLDVADDAGARIVKGSIDEAAKLAKASWLLILPAAVGLAQGWEDALAAHINGPGGAARIGPAGGLWARLTRGRGLGEGLLIDRALYERIGGWSRARGRGRRLGWLNV